MTGYNAWCDEGNRKSLAVLHALSPDHLHVMDQTMGMHNANPPFDDKWVNVYVKSAITGRVLRVEPISKEEPPKPQLEALAQKYADMGWKVTISHDR